MTPQMPDLPPGPSLETVRGPVEIPTYAPWQYGVIVAIVLICLALVGYALYRLLNRPRRESSIDPFPAYQQEIEAAKLLPTEDARSPQMISQATRRYLRAVFPQLPDGLTSAELCRHLLSDSSLDLTTIPAIKELLAELDHLKFAPVERTPEQIDALVQRANAIVSEIEQARQAAEQAKEGAQP